MKPLFHDLVIAPLCMLGIVLAISVAFIPVRVVDAITRRDATDRLCQRAMDAVDRYVFADLHYGKHND